MNIKSIFCIPFILLIGSCKTKTTQTQPSGHATKSITIALEKQVKIPDSKVVLEFKDVVDDSRCPVNVTCVWEGIAIVNVGAVSGNNRQNFQVATRDFEQKNVTNTFRFSGYKFTLEDLKPQPGGKEEPTTVSFKYEKED